MKLGILSLLIITVIVVGLSSTVFMMFLSAGYDSYGPNYYNQSDLKSFQRLENSKSVANATGNLATQDIQNPDDPGSDIGGGLFRSGLSAADRAYDSAEDMNFMSKDAVKAAGLDSTVSSASLTSISTIILIIIFIGWAISAKVRKNS